jgi:hypothetical protein
MIEEYPAVVPIDLCDAIVMKFESDPRKGPSTVGNAGRISDHRRGVLLRVNEQYEDWRPFVNAIFPYVQSCLAAYAAKYESIHLLMESPGLVCRYPLIERTGPGDGFDWHMDVTMDTATRVLAVLVYLRDVASGGFTEFKFQNRRVAPGAGKVALFPPYWTHYHRGVAPLAGNKYVMSFFWTYPPVTPEPQRETRGFLQRLRGRK